MAKVNIDGKEYEFDNGIHIPSWHIDANQPDDLEKLYQSIILNKITSIVIQFNYGFFDFYFFSKFIHKLKDQKINILIFLHSTIDPESSEDKKLINLIDSFRLCERIFVHSLDDLNRLKKLGLVNNVSIFPHGFLINQLQKIKNENLKPIQIHKKRVKLRIATYGFCLPNKGFEELIRAVKILKDKNFPVELNILSSIYSSDYKYYSDLLLNTIDELDLTQHVSLNCEYMEDDETLNQLNSHDLIIFPYQKSNESSSAAVRHGLASLRPVLVTPLHIFHDIDDLVYYLKGFTPELISESILDWFRSHEKSNDMFDKKSSTINAIKSLGFDNLSERLHSIIQSLEKNKYNI